METRVGTLDGDESGYAAWRREWVRCMETRGGALDGDESRYAGWRRDWECGRERRWAWT